MNSCLAGKRFYHKMEKTEKQDEYKFAINVKVNAKGEPYGEFTVRSNDFVELETELQQVKSLFTKYVGIRQNG